MTKEECKADLKSIKATGRECIDYAIECIEKLEQIEQIIDDCDLEAWEVLEKIKGVVRNGRDL